MAENKDTNQPEALGSSTKTKEASKVASEGDAGFNPSARTDAEAPTVPTTRQPGTDNAEGHNTILPDDQEESPPKVYHTGWRLHTLTAA